MENLPNSIENQPNPGIEATPNWQELADMANQQPDFEAIVEEVNHVPDPAELADAANRANNSFAALEQASTPQPETAADTAPAPAEAAPAVDPNSQAGKTYAALMEMADGSPVAPSETTAIETVTETTTETTTPENA